MEHHIELVYLLDFCATADRSEIIKNWPRVNDPDTYAPPESILWAVIIWLEKTSCEINKDRSKLSQVHQALRKFNGE